MTDSAEIEAALGLVDAVVYADVFDTAADGESVLRFARVRADAGALEQALQGDGLASLLVSRAPTGAVTLRGREHLAASYETAVDHAARLRRRATRVARVLHHVPFVRGIMLTGSVAAGAAPPDADVDLLVIVATERVGTVFALLAPVSRLLGRRLFCPNFYLCEQALTFETQDVYVGHELGQTVPLAGDAVALRRANTWVEQMFPNLPPAEPVATRRRGVLQTLLELPLQGRLGIAVEGRARRLAASRLEAHYRGDVPADVSLALQRGLALRFHASGVEHSVPERYHARRRELAERATAQSGRNT